MSLIISEKILEKIAAKTPPVTKREIEQCFNNREYGLLTDTREQHKTNPPTQWFVAYTNHGRALKIMFIQDKQDIYLKSAYDATVEIQRIYLNKAT
jgi:hypothetical protein